MDADSTERATGSGYAAGSVTKAPNWHGLVVLDILLNNLTTGLFLIAGLGELAAPEVFTAVARVAYPIALVLLVADLLCLVFDLGDPLRFHHMLRVFKPSSPMSLGTWCLTIHALPLTVLAVFSFWPGGGATLEWGRWLMVMAGLLPALGAAVYKGVLFSTSSQPGWKDARWLGGYFVTSALLLGAGALLGISMLIGQEKAMETLRIVVMVFILLNAMSLGLLAFDIRAVLGQPQLRRGLGRSTVLVVVAGLVVPLGLFLVGAPLAMSGAILLLLLGALAIRFEIVRMPHVLGRRTRARREAPGPS